MKTKIILDTDSIPSILRNNRIVSTMTIDLLLDTHVTSELRRARHPDIDHNFAAWAESVDLARACISVITIHEIMRGVLLVERNDPARGWVYRAWVEDLLEAFDGRILFLTPDVAITSAAFHIPNPAPLADALIAGTAHTHSLTVVTRNTSAFTRFGVPVLNPWEPVSGI